MRSSTYVVVLAGGAGTRFWPRGRKARPKQLLPITGTRSLLAETLDRCAPLAPPERTIVVTNAVQLEATRAECPRLPPNQVVAEPAMRNTAAAIGFAALLVGRRDPEAVMVVLPADHYIHPQEAFVACFRAAVERAATAGCLLTIGVRPTGPATGYGYIESGAAVGEVGGHPVHKVTSFKEKPDAATAARFIEAGNYFWNAGTFVWKVSTLLEAFARHLPEHRAVLADIDRRLDAGDGPAPEEYERFADIPIDIGIMERASNVEVIPSNFAWDDVGSWLAIDRLRDRDEAGNVVQGSHVGIDTRNCILFSDGHLLATIGLEGLIVVHTADATLICPKSRAEEVRRIVKRLKEEGGERYT